MKNEQFKVILLVILIGIVGLYAGESDKNDLFEIQCVTEKREGIREPITTKINFINTKTNTILQSIDLIDDNPYCQLPYTKDKVNRSENIFCTFSNIYLGDIFNDFSWMFPPMLEKHRNEKIWKAEVWTMYEIKEEFILIEYLIMAYANPDILLGQKTDFELYNIKGDLIFSLQNLTDGPSSFTITNNGDYLAYIHGQQIAEFPKVFNCNLGIKIYETSTGNLILDKEFNDNIELLGIHSKNNIIGFGTKEILDSLVYKRITSYIIPDDNVIYSAVIPVDVFNRLKEYSKEGLILGKQSKQDSETEIYTFEKNFGKVKF